MWAWYYTRSRAASCREHTTGMGIRKTGVFLCCYCHALVGSITSSPKTMFSPTRSGDCLRLLLKSLLTLNQDPSGGHNADPKSSGHSENRDDFPCQSQECTGSRETHVRTNSIPDRYNHLSQLLTWQSRNDLGNGILNIPKVKQLFPVITCGLQCIDKQLSKLKDMMYQQSMLYLLSFKGQLNHYHTTMTASTQDRSKSLLNRMVISI